MRWLGPLLIIVASTISVQADDWTTADGKTYKNIVVIGQESDGVRVTYEGGVGKLPYYELDDETLRKLGQDPAAQAIKRAAFVKAQAEAALQAKQDAAIAAEQKRKDAQAAALAAAQAGNPATPDTASAPQDAASGQNPIPGQPPPPPGSNPAMPQTATTQNPGQPLNPAPATPSPSQSTAAAGPNKPATPTDSPQPNFIPPRAAPAPTPAPAPTSTDTASDSSSTSDEQQRYPNSKFQYDDTADISYLESNIVEIQLASLDAPPPAPGQKTTLQFRITTEGRRAESPDEVQGIFNSNVALKKLATDRRVKFLVDGAFIPALPPIESSDAEPDPLRSNQVTFLLSPEQTRAILSGKKVNVTVGGSDYRIDDAAMTSLHGFMADITKLPPASTDYMKMIHRFVNRLPSIISVISATCEYIILSAFGIVMVASIAAFVMGLTRFIKM